MSKVVGTREIHGRGKREKHIDFLLQEGEKALKLVSMQLIYLSQVPIWPHDLSTSQSLMDLSSHSHSEIGQCCCPHSWGTKVQMITCFKSTSVT